MIGQRWMRWTLGEAFMKATSATLQKQVGLASKLLAHTLFATGIVGLVQTFAGLFATRRSKKPLVPNRAYVLGSITFGFFAFLSTLLGFSAYQNGGEVSVQVFIITLSIIPGALIDWVVFGHKLVKRQMFAILVALFGGYCVLGFPSLEEALKLPLWVWLSLGITVTVAINQGVTQKIKGVDPMVKNFWGGLTAVILSSVLISVTGVNRLADPQVWTRLVPAALLIGFVVIVMWTCNVMSYKDGAAIAIKKLVMNGTYLTLAMVIGICLYGEAFTVGKVLGVIIFILAFCLFDNGTWQSVSGLWTSKKVAAA